MVAARAYAPDLDSSIFRAMLDRRQKPRPGFLDVLAVQYFPGHQALPYGFAGIGAQCVAAKASSGQLSQAQAHD